MPQNSAELRPTEGPRAGEPAPLSRHRKSRGGRPKGSKNKPKSLVPKELAHEMLLAMRDQLPQEHFEYIKGVIQDGKAISTKQELDTLILLLSRNLYPALVSETKVNTDDPDDDGPKFRRDVTERLKVLNSLLSLRNQIEKREDGGDDDRERPLLKLWADRNLEGRIAVLVGTPGRPAGDDNGTGRASDEAGAISDQISERPLSLPSS